MQTEQWNQEELSSAISGRVASTLYQMKANLESEMNTADFAEAAVVNEDSSIALLQEHIYALTHSWRQTSAIGQVGLTELPVLCQNYISRYNACAGLKTSESEKLHSKMMLKVLPMYMPKHCNVKVCYVPKQSYSLM